MNTAMQNRPAPIQALSETELLARFQNGVRNPGLVEDHIEQLFEDAEANHDAPPVEERSWLTSRTEILYSHPLFGKITIGVKNCSLGESETKGPNSWARVYIPEGRPNVLELQMTVRPINGIKTIDFRADPMSESDEQTAFNITGKCGFTPFPVNVQWLDRGPFTRVKHRDNLDIILLNPESGQFIQVEISITTRNGYFWLLVQELQCGQWVRTTKAKAAELGLTTIAHGRYPMLVVPLYMENAYPGADYLKTFPEIGQQVAQMVIQWEAFVPYHKCVMATWAPAPAELPEAMRAKGWELGVPKFFNGVVGFGPVVCEDGETCFLHFSKIIGNDGAPVGSRGQLPMVEPMKYIALKWTESDRGRQATAVRVL